MSYKIAVIEDNESIASMYRFKLEYSGYLTASAHDGRSGLVLAKEYNPDVILLDLKMPIETGDAMLEKLRATTWGKNMKVIILTNISKNEAPHKLRFLNVDRYIVKAHHTPTQVVQIVDEVLGHNRPL